MKKIKLKSTYPCIVKTKDEFFDIDEYDMLEIEDEKRIFVYPINESRRNIPFYIDLENLQNSRRYGVFNFESFSLLVLNDEKPLRICNKEHLSFKSGIVTVSLFCDRLKFETPTYCVEEDVEAYDKFKVFKLDKFACVSLDDDRLYAFNTADNRLALFAGESVELNNNELVLNKIYSGFDKHTRTSKYLFEDGQIKLQSEDLKCETQSKWGELLSVRFLEAVRANNFEMARGLLSEKLKMKVSAESLLKFFGKIKAILPISLKEFVLVCDLGKKYVQIQTSQNAIEDISVDEL